MHPLDNVEDLKNEIGAEIRLIFLETIRNVQNEFNHRLGYCQVENAAQFEHVMFLNFYCDVALNDMTSFFLKKNSSLGRKGRN